jgi:hypothetical protein
MNLLNLKTKNKSNIEICNINLKNKTKHDLHYQMTYLLSKQKEKKRKREATKYSWLS